MANLIEEDGTTTLVDESSIVLTDEEAPTPSSFRYIAFRICIAFLVIL
jgi:hypothetical protein